MAHRIFWQAWAALLWRRPQRLAMPISPCGSTVPCCLFPGSAKSPNLTGNLPSANGPTLKPACPWHKEVQAWRGPAAPRALTSLAGRAARPLHPPKGIWEDSAQIVERRFPQWGHSRSLLPAIESEINSAAQPDGAPLSVPPGRVGKVARENFEHPPD